MGNLIIFGLSVKHVLKYLHLAILQMSLGSTTYKIQLTKVNLQNVQFEGMAIQETERLQTKMVCTSARVV